MVIIAALFGFGLLSYFLLIGLAFVFNLQALAPLRKIVESNLAFNLGIPASAVGAFGIVAVFWSAFPQTSDTSGNLGLEFFDLSFTGPSGPISLWVVCFLSLVFAMYLLKDAK